MCTCLNLIVVKNVTFNTSKAAKKDGIKDGDQMKLTTQRLKKLIREELSKKELDNKKEMDSGSKDAAADFKKGKKRDIKDKSEIYKSNYGKTYQDLEDEELEDMND